MKDVMKQVIACSAADKQIFVYVIVCFTMEVDLDGDGEFMIFLGKFSCELNGVGLFCSCGVKGGWLGGGRGCCHDNMAVGV